jgi:predicted CoA-substrate-specific enzyme activase
MICAGVDVGSISAKAALYDSAAGQVLGVGHMLTGWSPRESGNAALHAALDAAQVGMDDIAQIVGTGYGRIALPFANRTLTEISCHARGAFFLAPETRTVVDIGGQDSKVISLDEHGRALDFAMNDRCAAGTGRFLQVMAAALGMDLDDMGDLALRSKSPAALSSVCTVFAESEVVGLIAQGVSRQDIAGGLCRAIAARTAALVGQVGIRTPILLTGGVAYNEGVRAALSETLGAPVNRPDQPHLVGAIGAAILAFEGVSRDETKS